MTQRADGRRGRARLAAVPALFFLSGFTSLVYQVLWLRDLGVVFGNAAHAAAVTLTVFFLGLAVGGWFWGARAARLRSPLATYGFLEMGIGAAGLLYFALVDIYRWMYAPLYGALEERFVLLVAVKFLLALTLLFPPAFLMGGNFPVVGQFLVRRREELGRVGSFLYGVNTAGAALGALAAGFYLPRALGFDGAYLSAVLASAAVGVVAWSLARGEGVEAAPGGDGAWGRTGPPEPSPDTSTEGHPPSSAHSEGPRRLVGLGPFRVSFVGAAAFLSGFLALGLEVAWTRMFAQVLQNSVYTFATILVVFLAALSAGSFLANRLTRRAWRPRPVLASILALAGTGTAATPFLFYFLTGGLDYVAGGAGGWNAYVLGVFATGAAVLFVPAVILGSVFPYLLRVEQSSGAAPGATIGRLLALNTAGAIVGSLTTGFVLLAYAGLWGSIQILSVGYLVLGAAAAWWAREELRATDGRAARLPRWAAAALPAVGLVLVLGLLAPTRLPLLQVQEGEEVLGVWEGNHGVVATVERGGHLRIKVNNFYTLGGTAAMDGEQNQALLPLMVHPEPDSVFFLGMGTGITAGASLHHPVRSVTVAELVPDVVTAARSHFGPYANGLFSDPRTRIIARDGRNHLSGTRERYDVIVGDLFIPWRSGVGSLYTLEHFRAAKDRLRPGGHFVQWLPLYQLSRQEFELIARTMLEAFPEVVAWRGDFFADRPILALVGSEGAEPLDPRVIARAGREVSEARGQLPDHVYEAVTLPFYAGNLGRADGVIPEGPLNTDSRPRLEYQAPITHRKARTGEARWFVGEELLEFLEELQEAVPPAADPYLAGLDDGRRGYVRAGLTYYRAAVMRELGRAQEADRAFQEFLGLLPIEFVPETEAGEAYSDFPR